MSPPSKPGRRVAPARRPANPARAPGPKSGAASGVKSRARSGPTSGATRSSRPAAKAPARSGARTASSPARTRRRRPSRRTLGLLAAVVVLVVAVGVRVTRSSDEGDDAAVTGSCSTTPGTDGAVYTLDLDQAANATTIAVVGKRLGLPNHAVTVALATALQESRLYNLAHGDRDSLGLFQQRPSQGWGSEEQVQDAIYASEAFYTHLDDVAGWETMPVTEAAQAVQYSAFPRAYAQWEPQARELAIALTGETAAGFTCRITPRPTDVTPAPDRAAATLEAELGSPHMEQTVPEARGWTVASWLVGHAGEHHLTTVSFGGRTWTRDAGSWQPDPAAPPDRVTAF